MSQSRFYQPKDLNIEMTLPELLEYLKKSRNHYPTKKISGMQIAAILITTCEFYWLFSSRFTAKRYQATHQNLIDQQFLQHTRLIKSLAAHNDTCLSQHTDALKNCRYNSYQNFLDICKEIYETFCPDINNTQHSLDDHWSKLTFVLTISMIGAFLGMAITHYNIHQKYAANYVEINRYFDKQQLNIIKVICEKHHIEASQPSQRLGDLIKQIQNHLKQNNNYRLAHMN